ncbi:MAG: SDR family oxidoreductase [Proteobacteria bacterium]|nr:SDR family oxidoreductase [Pseudomonadota bacterium]
MSNLAVITGASRGIGNATAQLFVEFGYAVVNISRTPASLDGVTNINADMSEPGWLEGVSDELIAQLDGADEIALVHNAGMMVLDRVGDMIAEQLRRMFEVNVVASCALNDLLIPLMKEGSSIVYVGSTLSEKSVPGVASYATSKHAVIGLMRSTCQDLVGAGIHTACVCPGLTDTDMLRGSAGNDPDVIANMARMQTFNRLVEPEEIAAAILSVVGQPVFNGAVLHANLGQISH